MTFPKEAAIACDALSAKHPELAKSGDDNDRRRLMQMIGEQVHFALGPRWGNKKRRGVGDDYRSKDTLAYDEGDETVTVWDCFHGDTRVRQVNEGAAGRRLPRDEAVFMPVTPTNHLGTVAPPAPEVTTVPPVVGPTTESAFETDVRNSMGRSEARETRIEERTTRMEEKLATLENADPAVAPEPPPDYETTVFGQRVTSRPKK